MKTEQCAMAHALVNGTLHAKVLVDSGASHSYMGIPFFNSSSLSSTKIPNVSLQLANGSYCDNPITRSVSVSLNFKGHNENRLTLLVGGIADFDIILGKEWLERHNPSIDWESDNFDFNSEYCNTNCTKDLIDQESEDDLNSETSFDGDQDILDNLHHTYTESEYIEQLKLYRISSIDSPQNTKELLDEEDDDEEEDFSSLPIEFADFKDVFRKKSADILPDHRSFDLGIDLMPGAQAPFMPMYPIPPIEVATLNNYIDENLAKGFIVPSKSPAGAPAIFVAKKDGTLRLCIDYKGLNKVTVKNRYPLPLVNDLLDKMHGSTIFSKIDLRAAYNLVRIREGDEWKTAFRTKRGLFEYKVMPFGLCNAPAAFQGMMDFIFKDFLQEFLVILLDDLGIHSKNRAYHIVHIRKILTLLRKHKLYAKLSKCEWFQEKIELLGHEVGINGISMCGDKLSTISEWPAPSNLKELQSFLGLANFYRRFIASFSKISLPLTKLLRKDCKWTWDTTQHDSFNMLKQSFLSEPVLMFPNTDQQFTVECDASDFALGAILSQIGTDSKLHPVSFYSRKFTPAEINYPVYDKELMAIVAALATWRQYLCGSVIYTNIYTDHKNLLYFTTQQQLTRRQARWSLYLSEFNFHLIYRKGTLQGKPDALSRRSDYEIKPTDITYQSQFQTVIDGTKLYQMSVHSIEDTLFPNSITANATNLAKVLGIDIDIENDQLAIHIKNDIANNPSLAEHWNQENGLLFYKNRVYVPESCQTRLLLLHHDSEFAGHKGLNPTLELIRRNYYFPKMASYVKHWIQSCQQCALSKTNRHKPYGLLQPLEISELPWTSISMDFIVKLPCSDGYDSILVVVDRMTKMSHFIPCNETIDAPNLAILVRKQIFRLHGLPNSIVSDRGATFVSTFWRAYLQSQGIQSKLSTAYHPQTDGQTERINSILKTYLRLFSNYNQDNWNSLLDQAEFCYNNTLHSSIKTTPFFGNIGYNPKFLPTELITPSDKQIDNPKANAMIQNLHDIQKELVEHLHTAASEMKKYADRDRQDITSFKVGDKVYISNKNIKTTRPSETLDYRNLGPVEIIERIGNLAYRVKLPETCKRHDVFHVSLLSKCIDSNIPNRQIIAPLPIIVNSQEEHYVNKIVSMRLHHGHIQYKVLWQGKPNHEATWEHEENLQELEALDIYTKKYPTIVENIKTKQTAFNTAKAKKRLNIKSSKARRL